jgi:CubicO group peptidase (beta-lactamase class C family)
MVLGAVSCLLSPAALFGSASLDVSIKQLDGSTITAQQIDATMTHLLEAGHVTGAGIAIFNDGAIACLQAYGFRDTEKRLPLTPDSVMTSASLSKAAFATLVMRLLHDGALDLDKPVFQYLPKPLPGYSKYADLSGDDRYKKLTLRILLSHTSGFHLALCFDKTGRGVLIMTNSSNGERIFKPLVDSLLGTTFFPFEWERYTPYTELARFKN